MARQPQRSLTVPIYENYKDYQPPRFVLPTIAKLLSEIPCNYITGLQSIVLTNAAAIGKGKTRRVKGEKYLRDQCLGFSHPENKGQAPWIEIVVDNVLRGSQASVMDRIVSHLAIARQTLFAEVLYHEVGHHLDSTIGAPAPTGEQAADAWKKRLSILYIRKHYWYAVPLLRLAKPIVNAWVGRRNCSRSKPLDRSLFE